MSDEYDEQRLPQVAQLKAEQANAETYGNGPLVERIDRTLAALRRREAAEQAPPTPEAEQPTVPTGRRASRVRVNTDQAQEE